MAAPAPHAGVALVTALNILEGFNISSQMSRNGTYHWIAEVGADKVLQSKNVSVFCKEPTSPLTNP